MLTATQTASRARRVNRRTRNLEDVAQMLGVSRSLLHREAKAGRLPFPFIRIGERYLVSEQVLEDVLAGKYSGPADDRAA